MSKKDYTLKQFSGSRRDKTGPTQKRDYKVNPKALKAYLDPMKKIHDYSFADFGFKPYSGKDMASLAKYYVRQTRRGILV